MHVKLDKLHDQLLVLTTLLSNSTSGATDSNQTTSAIAHEPLNLNNDTSKVVSKSLSIKLKYWKLKTAN
jgi:hypothetical protein